MKGAYWGVEIKGQPWIDRNYVANQGPSDGWHVGPAPARQKKRH